MILIIDILAVIIIIITSFSDITTFVIVISKHSSVARQFRLEIKGPREAGKGRQAQGATLPCCGSTLTTLLTLCQQS